MEGDQRAMEGVITGLFRTVKARHRRGSGRKKAPPQRRLFPSATRQEQRATQLILQMDTAPGPPWTESPQLYVDCVDLTRQVACCQ